MYLEVMNHHVRNRIVNVFAGETAVDVRTTPANLIACYLYLDRLFIEGRHVCPCEQMEAALQTESNDSSLLAHAVAYRLGFPLRHLDMADRPWPPVLSSRGAEKVRYKPS